MLGKGPIVGSRGELKCTPEGALFGKKKKGIRESKGNYNKMPLPGKKDNKKERTKRRVLRKETNQLIGVGIRNQGECSRGRSPKYHDQLEGQKGGYRLRDKTNTLHE